MTPRAAFYCVSSARYFVGAVGMINSLRLLGHDEPVYVMDCGLSRDQRESLAAEATIVQAPPEREPHTLKPVLPLERPAEAMVLIDADIVVTRSLAPLIEGALAGDVVAFRDHADRFREEWGPLLGLGPLEPRPYVCSGLVATGCEPGEEVLRLVDELQGRVETERSYFGGHDDDYPLLYADQDVLNAVLSSRVPAERITALEHRLAPMIPFEGLSVVDPGGLRCAYADGTEPFVVHHSLSPKPWERSAYEGVYTRLLRRLLTGDDVAIRLPESGIPLSLRDGPIATAERMRVKAREQLRWRLGGAA